MMATRSRMVHSNSLVPVSMVISVVMFPPWSFRDGALAPDPESRDSGFDATHRPGMTAPNRFTALAMAQWIARNEPRCLRRQLYPRNSQRREDDRDGRGVAGQCSAELLRLQISGAARLRYDPGQSRSCRQEPTRKTLRGVAHRHRPPGRHDRHLPELKPHHAGGGGSPENVAIAEGDLDATRRARRCRRGEGRSCRSEGRDEPLPEDRIRPPVLGDFMDGRQFAHAEFEA